MRCNIRSRSYANPTWVGLFASVMIAALSACSAPDTRAGLDELTPVALNDTQMRAQRRLVLATAYFEQAQNDFAMQEVHATLNIDPHHAGAHNLLGLIHQRNNAFTWAQQSFETSAYWAKQTANTRELADAQHNLGWLLCQQAHYAQAQAQFEQALMQVNYRQHGKTHMTAGLCYLQAGQIDAARRSWQQSLQSDSLNPMARYQLALLDWQTQPEQAQKLLAPLHTQDLATPESLWLGLRVAKALDNSTEMLRLGQQLQQRYPASVQAKAWIERKFDQP